MELSLYLLKKKSIKWSHLPEENKVISNSIQLITDYGHPERTFFFKNSNLLGLGKQIGLKFFEAFRVFSAKLLQ